MIINDQHHTESRPMEKRKPGRPSNSQLRKNEILEKASYCFTLKGYNETTLDEISDSLGFNKAALYYYFKNKEDLFSQVLNFERLRLWELAKAETDAVVGLENKILKYFAVRTEIALVQIKINDLTRSNIIELQPAYAEALNAFRMKEAQYLHTILSERKTDHSIEETMEFIHLLLNVASSITTTALLIKDLEHNLSSMSEIIEKKEKVLKHLLNSYYTGHIVS